MLTVVKMANQLLELERKESISLLLDTPRTINELSKKMHKHPDNIKKELRQISRKYPKIIRYKRICKAKVFWIDFIKFMEISDVNLSDLPDPLIRFIIRKEIGKLPQRIEFYVFLLKKGILNERLAIKIEDVPKDYQKYIKKAGEMDHIIVRNRKVFLTEIGEGIAEGAVDVYESE